MKKQLFLLSAFSLSAFFSFPVDKKIIRKFKRLLERITFIIATVIFQWVSMTLHIIIIMKKQLVLLSTFLSAFFFFSYGQENNPEIQAVDFEEVAFSYFASVSEDYQGDVNMTIEERTDGILYAVFQLTGESKENAERDSWAARIEEGATCDGLISCVKALKKCLDNGQKGVIANGACVQDCVTCE